MKNFLFLVVFIFNLGFSQEDAWVYFNDKPDATNYLSNPLTMLTQRALDRRTAQGIALNNTDLYMCELVYDEYGINSNDYLFRHGVHKNKILLFLNSFDKTKFLNENSNDSKQINNNIIFVGRLSPEKNLSSLISLFRYFKADQLDYKLILVGDGPLKENLQKEILKYDLNIDIIGSILWNDLSELYKNSLCLNRA